MDCLPYFLLNVSFTHLPHLPDHEMVQADGSSSTSPPAIASASSSLGVPGGGGVLNFGGVLLRLPCGSLNVRGRAGRNGGDPDREAAVAGGGPVADGGPALMYLLRLLICGCMLFIKLR